MPQKAGPPQLADLYSTKKFWALFSKYPLSFALTNAMDTYRKATNIFCALRTNTQVARLSGAYGMHNDSRLPPVSGTVFAKVSTSSEWAIRCRLSRSQRTHAPATAIDPS